jgi:hypothetical protein
MATTPWDKAPIGIAEAKTDAETMVKIGGYFIFMESALG